MSLNRRLEFVCGIAAGLLGIVVLGIDLFAQGSVSTICGASGCVTTHANFLQSQSVANILDALVVVGGPPILVAVGAILASWRDAVAGRVLLWIGTPILGLYAVIGLLFGGGLMLGLQIASFAFAVAASDLVANIVHSVAKGTAQLHAAGGSKQQPCRDPHTDTGSEADKIPHRVMFARIDCAPRIFREFRSSAGHTIHGVTIFMCGNCAT